MGIATEINTYIVHHKVPGYTFGEKGEKSPYLIQCGIITAPEPSYIPVWVESEDKMDLEERPPLNKPEFLRWPELGNYPGRPGTPVFIRTRAEAQAMVENGDAKKIRDAYYASRVEAERLLRERADNQAVKVSGGAMANMLKEAVTAAVAAAREPAEEKRGPGRPRSEANGG